MTFLADGSKALTVARIYEIMTEYSLLETDQLRPNRVGNLSVIRDGKSIGFIDFSGDGDIEFHDAGPRVW